MIFRLVNITQALHALQVALKGNEVINLKVQLAISSSDNYVHNHISPEYHTMHHTQEAVEHKPLIQNTGKFS